MNIKVQLSREENIKHYNANNVIIDFEEYVKGVVPSEIGNSHIEACKAQAVAARTFALSRSRGKGYITDKSSTDQAFRASRISSSYPNAMQAVEETKGEVLYFKGKLVETCVYSASNGGRIKSSQERWGGVRGYLIAKDDPYDTGSGNGHGVGMSQNGAKNMAAQGFTYKDILNFYYPGTELRANYGEKELVPVAEKTKAQVVIDWAYSKLDPKCGYIWGTAGQTCTQALINSKHAQYPDHVDPSIVSKWLGMQVFDCQGFVQQAMKQVGIQMVSGANSQWLKTTFEIKGTIDTLPSDKVCCLYRKDAKTGKMGHTGLYLGDGQTFIHAAGSKTGVVKSTIKEYGRWTHWGIPAGLYDNGVNIVITISNLQRGAYGASVKMLQEMLVKVGEVLPKYGADSDFGAETEAALKNFQTKNGLAVTGIVDATTENLLYEKTGTEKPSTEPDPDEGDRDNEPEVIKVAYQAKVQPKNGSTVNMRSGMGTSTSVITRVAAGQIVDVHSVTGDWAAITWNGKSGYMMNEYLVKVDGSEKNQVWYVRIECDSEAQAKAIASFLAKAKATT